MTLLVTLKDVYTGRRCPSSVLLRSSDLEEAQIAYEYSNDTHSTFSASIERGNSISVAASNLH